MTPFKKYIYLIHSLFAIVFPAIFFFLDACTVQDTVQPPPVINGFTPASGVAGTVVNISGTNFSAAAANNIVKFAGTAAVVTTATVTSLTVSVPSGAATGKISVDVNDKTGLSSDDFIVFGTPEIQSFSPVSGSAGTVVIITGKNFSTTLTDNVVKFETITANVSAATETSLSVTIPEEANTGKINVTVHGLTATSAADFIILPKITSFTPSAGAVGSTVTITGKGFDPAPANNTVKFGDINTTVTEATKTALKVIVPSAAVTGKIKVTVGVNTAESAANYEVVVEAVKAGSTSYDQGFSVAVDAQGNTYVAGLFQGTASFGTETLTSSGSDDIFIVKYNSSCDVVWAKRAGGTGADRAISITADASGNTWITGNFVPPALFGATTLNFGIGGMDAFVAMYNSSGEVVWAKEIVSGNTDSGYSVKVDGSGNLYVSGSFFNSVTVGTTTLNSAGGSDAFVIKYNAASGDLIWAKRFGGTDDDSAISTAFSAAGDVYIAGSFFGTATFGAANLTSAGSFDAFVARLNTSGEVVWVKQLAGTSNENIYGLAADASGNCYVTGYFTGTSAIGATTLTAAGNEDVFVAKLSLSSGEVIWAKTFGGSDYDNGNSIALDAAGNVYATGYFARTATFGTTSITSVNFSRDIFVLKLNNAGEIQFVKQAGAADNDYGQGVAVSSSGIIHATGFFNGTVTFGTTPLTSFGSDDIYLWKIRQ